VLNPNVPLGILESMANDPDVTVRCGVAVNPGTPPGTLYSLARDPSISVRRWVAKNPSVPPDLLEGLLRDDPRVAKTAADNPNLPSATRAMWQLATQGTIGYR
jgi:hypothetical protein